MARAIAETMAVPRRLSLGCQRQSLYFPRPRAKEGRWADAGVSKGLSAGYQGEAASLNISDRTAKFRVPAILGKLAAATRTEAIALGIPCGLVLLHSRSPSSS